VCKEVAIGLRFVHQWLTAVDQVRLQGLIPRVRELAKLGGSVFLAFAPAVIVISVFFTVLYAVRMANEMSRLVSTVLHTPGTAGTGDCSVTC